MGGVFSAQGPRAGGNRCSMRLSRGSAHAHAHTLLYPDTIRPLHISLLSKSELRRDRGKL